MHVQDSPVLNMVLFASSQKVQLPSPHLLSSVSPAATSEDAEAETAFIIANKAGTFVLVGTPTEAEWLEPAAPPPVIDDTDEGEDDELDFEMF